MFDFNIFVLVDMKDIHDTLRCITAGFVGVS